MAHNHIELDALQLLVESLIQAENRALHALTIEGNPGYYPNPTQPRLPLPFSSVGQGLGTVTQGGKEGGGKEGGVKREGGRKGKKSKTETVSATGGTSISPSGEGGSSTTETIAPGGLGDVLGVDSASSSSGAVTGIDPSSQTINGHHTTATTTTNTTTTTTASQRKSTPSLHPSQSPSPSSSPTHHSKYRDSHAHKTMDDLALALAASTLPLSVILQDLVTNKVATFHHPTHYHPPPFHPTLATQHPLSSHHLALPSIAPPFPYTLSTPSHPLPPLPLSITQAESRLEYMPKGVKVLLKKWMARQRDETTRAVEMSRAQAEGHGLGPGQGQGLGAEGGIHSHHHKQRPSGPGASGGGASGGASGRGSAPGQGLGSGPGQGKGRSLTKATTAAAATTTSKVTVSSHRATGGAGTRTSTSAKTGVQRQPEASSSSSSSSHRHRQSEELGPLGSGNGTSRTRPTTHPTNAFVNEERALSDQAANELRSLGFVVKGNSNSGGQGPGQGQGHGQGQGQGQGHIRGPPLDHDDLDDLDEDLSASPIRDPWQSLSYEEVGGPPSNDYGQGLGTLCTRTNCAQLHPSHTSSQYTHSHDTHSQYTLSMPSDNFPSQYTL